MSISEQPPDFRPGWFPRGGSCLSAGALLEQSGPERCVNTGYGPNPETASTVIVAPQAHGPLRMGNIWAAKNPDKWREYKKEWAAKNPEKILAHKKAWAEKNPDYRQRNKERFAARASAYWAANKHDMISQELLRAARRRAKVKGIECSITLADIEVPELCPLLGVVLKKGDGRQEANSPTLDRICNSRGYVQGNVWVISHLANACKGSLTAEQLIQMGTRLREKEASLVGGAPNAG